MEDYQFAELYNATNLDQCMITLPEYFKQVRKVEGCADIDIEQVNDIKRLDDYYIVKYPFVTPCYPLYAEAGVDALSESTRCEWIDTIMKTALPRTRFKLHKTVYEELCGRDDIGIILHYFSGEVIPFEYKELMNIKFATNHKVISDLYKISRLDRKERIERFKSFEDDAWYLYFTMHFNNPDGDEFNHNGECNMYCYDALPKRHLDSIIETIRLQILLKRKIILVP